MRRWAIAPHAAEAQIWGDASGTSQDLDSGLEPECAAMEGWLS